MPMLPEVGIYKRKQESKKENTLDQESDDNGQERKHVLDKESKIQEKTITITKKRRK